jgi:Mrp family chromosome partitioning ATPase
MGLPNPSVGAGAAAGAGVVAAERGDATLHQTLLTLTATPLTLTALTVQGGGIKVYDFPEGRILIHGAVGTMTFTTTSILANTLNLSSTGNWGVGSVTQVNPTLATTEQNIIPTTNFTSSAVINVAGSTTSKALAAALQLDGTTTAIDAFLNVGVASAGSLDADATITATGTILITWTNIGDY